MSQPDESISRDEVRKEFQLERMILFSDAVFAIVITLMAIEIRMPETDVKETGIYSMILFKHLFPVILAYTVSFIFIGSIWYQHLKIFSVLRDYDKGLVVRNLILLFFIGLFPFSATVIGNGRGAPVAMMVYLSVILLCSGAQFVLHHYILFQKPQLRVEKDIHLHFEEYDKKKSALISFIIIIGLILVTLLFIQDPHLQPMAVIWMAVFPLLQKVFKKKKK